MKLLITLLFTAALFPTLASAAGREGNGGDVNERFFKEVAKNIFDWIKSGNADGLNLSDLSTDTYKKKMTARLLNYNVKFSDRLPIVHGTSKTCENKMVGNRGVIECNLARFDALRSSGRTQDIEELYRLIHHEFAGLEGLEQNRGDDSDYTISNQLSAFLRTETVRRLPVTSTNPEDAPSAIHPKCDFALARSTDEYVFQLERAGLKRLQGTPCKVLDATIKACSAAKRKELYKLLRMSEVMGNYCMPHTAPPESLGR